MATMGFIQKTTQSSSRLQNNLVPINFTHAHAIGQTGCGKTTSFIYPNLDHRIEQGHSVLLYDFKGKEHMSLKYFAQKHGRLSYEAECLYQNKVLNLSDEYVLEKTLTDQVFIFNSRQYAKNIMQLVNFKSLQTDTVEFMLKADYDRAVRTAQNFTNERLEGLEDSQKIEPMDFTAIQNNNNMDKILDYIEEVYNATA